MEEEEEEKGEEAATLVIDAYQNWLEKQPVKKVRAKSGFISHEEIEGRA